MQNTPLLLLQNSQLIFTFSPFCLESQQTSGTCGLKNMEPISCGKLALRCVPTSILQYSTAQHSTAQHSTAQCSAVQCSTVQYTYCIIKKPPGPTRGATRFFPCFSFSHVMSVERAQQPQVKSFMLPVHFEAPPYICQVPQGHLAGAKAVTVRET